MSEHDCVVGFKYGEQESSDIGELVTGSQIKNRTVSWNDYKFTDLDADFTYCPECGSKIDWDKIKAQP